MPPTVTLDPGDRLRVSLTFQPNSPRSPRGRLFFRSNSGLNTQRAVSLPITGLNTIGELHLSQNPIHFGRVVAGETSEKTLTLTNFGTHTARLDKLAVHGSPRFSIRVDGVDPKVRPEVLQDPDGDGLPGLSPDGQVNIQVLFRPATQQAETGELHISSNAHTPKRVVALIGNAAAPCVYVTPTHVEFPPTAIDAERVAMIRVESCGAEAVTIETLSLVSGMDAYSIRSAPEAPIQLPATTDGEGLAPGIDLIVVFKPGENTNYLGKISLTTTDPERPNLDIKLSGRGVENRCPTPRIATEDQRVRPLDVITLDGTPSTDPDGPQSRPVEYAWVIVDRPAGSTTQPVERLLSPSRPAEGGAADDPQTPTAQLFIDLAGEYTLELRVTDHFGAEAPSALCPTTPARLHVKAVPEEALHVELTWATPSDRDQTDDEGTDVDLHLRHPEAQGWAQSDGLDCYYQNQSPDWGQPGDARDDPTLDIDDVNGAGPENINLSRPERSAETQAGYQVGVHYYSAEHAGGADAFIPVPSTARVRIYIEGAIAYVGERRLEATGDFWTVAEVRFNDAGGQVTETNTLSTLQP